MKTLKLTANISNLKTTETERLGLPSASAATRLTFCPGSYMMEKNQPELIEYEEDADSGDRIHQSLEGKEGVTLSPQEQETRDKLKAARDRYINHWQDTVVPPDAPEGEHASIEERWFLHAGLTPVSSGKWDYLASRGLHFLVLDYKTGWQELPPLRLNFQLRVYAILVYQKHPEAESVTVGIVKPGDYEKEDMYLFTYKRQDLEAAWLWWENVLNNVFSPTPILSAGDHCQFCKAKAVCNKRLETLDTLTRYEGGNESWEMMSPQRRADLYRAAKTAASLAEAIKERTKKDLQDGIILPGLSLDKDKSRGFDIDNPNDAFAAATAAGMTRDEFMAVVTVSHSQLRDVLRKKLGWKEKESNDRLAALLKGGVTQKWAKGGIKG